MTLRVIYFELPYAFTVHEIVINQSGGLNGVKNQEYLESVLGHIKNDTYYPEFIDKLNHLVFSVIKLHAFNDGNKRTSIALGSYFLEINGYDFLVTKFIREMENIAVYVATNKVDKDLLRELIYSIIYDDDYPEGLKLKYLLAIS